MLSVRILGEIQSTESMEATLKKTDVQNVKLTAKVEQKITLWTLKNYTPKQLFS